MDKYLRGTFFRQNPIIKMTRHTMGCEEFDNFYRKMYNFLSRLQVGQYFVVSKLCKNIPERHGLVLLMCEIYNNMDFFVNLDYNEELDRITVMPTRDGINEGLYSPPDVYSKIIKNPEGWGVCPEDI